MSPKREIYVRTESLEGERARRGPSIAPAAVPSLPLHPKARCTEKSKEVWKLRSWFHIASFDALTLPRPLIHV